MNGNEHIDYSSLNWVKGEIDITLNQAQQSLEAYAENPSDPTQLRFCITYLHQVRGTLQMLELYGAALLAEEAEYTAQALLHEQIERREEAYELLMRALLQLPGYLERLQAGYRDIPLVLLPLLNDLRTCRGQHLLSENVLFAPDLSVAAPRPAAAEPAASESRTLAQRLRPAYQAALVAWYRNPADTRALARLQLVITQLELASTEQAAIQLWWVASGLIEALIEHGLEPGTSVRYLLGQVDRQIKQLIDEGEAALDTEQREELVKNLLFYVARSRSAGARVGALREAFALDTLLPSEAEVDAARSDLGGPDAQLLRTVAQAVTEELLRLKDVLDLFVRNPAHPPAELEPMAQGLRQVADTLGMLGLGVLRGKIQEQAGYVGTLLDGSEQPSDAGLMKIASALLYVESALEGLSRRELRASAGEEEQAQSTLPESEYRQLMNAVIQEAKADVGNIKEAIASWALHAGTGTPIAEVPQWLTQVKGGLVILGLMQAAQLVNDCRSLIQGQLIDQSIALGAEGIDALADAITSVEYYLEAVAENRGDKGHILALGQHSLARLQRLLAQEGVRAPAAPPPAAVEAAPAAAEPAAAPAPAEAMEDEVIETFLEEAAEELAVIREQLARWRTTPAEQEALGRIRRAFHTLKGSGRLVGASAAGEFAWAMESMLNRVISGAVPASAPMFALLEQAGEALAQLVEQFRGGAAPTRDVDALAAEAERLAQGEAVAPPEAPPAPPSEPRAAEPAVPAEAEEAEPEAVDQVFLEEAAELLETIEQQLQALLREPHKRAPLGELQRALHTLKGGARMAGIAPVGDLCHALESLLETCIEQTRPVGKALLDLLQAAHDRIVHMVEAVQAHILPAAAEDLIERIEALAAPQPPAAEPAVTPSEAAPVEAAPLPRAAPLAGETIRVRAEALDQLVNAAAELGIFRSRLGQQLGSIRYNLGELDQTAKRIHEQIRRLEIEAEAQLFYSGLEQGGDHARQYDALEFDRFSQIHQLSRGLLESAADLGNLHKLLKGLTQEAEVLLTQQGRINAELQEGLMSTRMVPFLSVASRLQRIARQTCQELGKQAQLQIVNDEVELDRTVLNRMLPVLEHMLRNAIDHGIESAQVRQAAGKPPAGQIRITLAHEGRAVVITLSDDGRGLDLEAIRRHAVDKGLLDAAAELGEQETVQFILAPGFSTARELTQISGRGVGMDVANIEIKQLGGALFIASQRGEGTRFTIHLPLTLAVQQALLVQSGEEVYALPLAGLEGITRVNREHWLQQLKDGAALHYGGHDYRCLQLNALLGAAAANPLGLRPAVPVLLYQLGDQRIALEVDRLRGSQEIVLKSVGPQVSTIGIISAGTILPDGRVALILDLNALIRTRQAQAVQPGTAAAPASAPIAALIVDDSITVRKVTSRFLERHRMHTVTAKDGVDAIGTLERFMPDVILLDIEMPRMNGFEFAAYVRSEARLRHIPIIMITSRSGDKHRQHALEVGADLFLGKPYNEQELLDGIYALTRRRA